MARDLPARLARQLQRAPLWETGSRILVAASGGADSTALLSMLAKIGIDVVACFVDHGNRDVSAETRFLDGLCHRLGIPFVHCRTSTNRTDEATLRRIRYRALSSVAIEHGLRHVATAHTADDQMETVLMRIVRGSSVQGLTGIPDIRRLPLDAATDAPRYIVRPLLGFRRSDIRGWLGREGIGFVEDPTNQDLRYLRNRLRIEIVPRLIEANPKLTEAVLRLARSATDIHDLLEAEVRQAAAQAPRPEPGVPPRLDATYLSSLPCAVRFELIRQFTRELPGRTGEITRVHVESVARLLGAATNRQTSLPGGIRVRRHGRWLEFAKKFPDSPESPDMVARPPAE